MSTFLVENGYGIRGIAPPDLKDYPEAAITFWQWVVAIGLKVKDRELSQGLNKDGKPLTPPISAYTRKHRKSAMTPSGKGDPSAPPLMPGRALSRTRSLLTGRAYPDRAEWWWRFDSWTGNSWAATLQHIADRWPGRDVFGLSPAAQKRVQAQALALWAKFKRGQTIPPMAQPTVPMAPAGPFVGPSARPRGGMTMAEIEAHYRAAAKPIAGRPPRANVLLRHVFGEPEPGKALGGLVMPRPPKPRPIAVARVALQAQPKPVSIVPAPLSLGQFAAQAFAAASSVPPAAQWAEGRVWIIDAYHAFILRHRMSLTEFKLRLVEANRARLITLARVDLPQRLTAEERIKQDESEVSQGPAVFHWIRV